MDHTYEPGMGHNGPPTSIEDMAVSAITAALAQRTARTNELVESYGRAPVIEGEDEAEKITTLIRLLQVQLDAVEASHRETKAPFIRANQAIDNLTGRERTKLLDPLNDLNNRLTVYQRAVQAALTAKRNAEQAELAARNEPEPVYEAPAPKKVTTRSVYGAKATLQVQKVYTVTDPKKVPIVILRNPKVLEAIISVARARLNQGEAVAGITSNTTTKSRVTG